MGLEGAVVWGCLFRRLGGERCREGESQKGVDTIGAQGDEMWKEYEEVRSLKQFGVVTSQYTPFTMSRLFGRLCCDRMRSGCERTCSRQVGSVPRQSHGLHSPSCATHDDLLWIAQLMFSYRVV